jgi:hypothetical protein
VVGIDAILDSGYEAQRSAFIRHFTELRHNLKTCPVLLAVESNNGGHAAMQHYKWLSEIGMDSEVTLMTESTQRGLPGVWTGAGPAMKSAMVDDLHCVLRKRGLSIYAGMFGRNPKNDLDELRDELLRFSKFPLQAKTPGGQTRYAISGKGIIGNMNDDIAMSLMINNSMAITAMSPSGCMKYNTDRMRATEPMNKLTKVTV